MKTNGLVILAAGLLLGACGNDDAPDWDNANGVAAVFTTNMDGRVQTRMADDAWATDDAIGIFSMNDEMEGVEIDGTAAPANIAENLKYTRTTAGWDGGTTAFRFRNPESPAVTFKAYFPYKEPTDITADATDGLKGGTIAVDATDQSADGQQAFDFLYADKDNSGKASAGSKENPTVNFQFAHSMAKVIVKFVPDGTTVTALNTDMVPSLVGLKAKGTFSLKDGVVTATDGQATTLALTNKTAGSSTAEQSFIAIVPPQTAPSDGIYLTVKANSDADQYLTAKLLPNGKLEAGNSYTLTLTVKKRELVVSDSDITPWMPNDNAGSGEAILQ